MRIAVLGAGAMGSLYGGYLSRYHDVVLVDVNKDRMNKINADGLIIQEPDGTEGIYHPHGTTDSSGMEPADAVIVFVKAMFSETALESNRSLIGPDTYILTFQNGSGHEDTLLKFTDEEHVVIGTTQHNCAVTGPGSVKHGGSGPTHLGCITGDVSRLQPLADAFLAAGFEADCSDRVQRLIWQKMFTNVSASALTGALQVPLGYIASNEHAWSMCETLIEEAVAAANADGMGFDAEQIKSEVRAVCEKSPNGITSICADLANGRRTEVDTISGGVVKAARRNGTSAPTHEFLVHMIHAMEEKPVQ